MKHKWVEFDCPRVKGEIMRKRCKRCGLQKRYIRKGSVKAFEGVTIVQFRVGSTGAWLTSDYRLPLPVCPEKFKPCPHCNGTGRVEID